MKSILLILIISIQFSFCQSEKDNDYDLYALILTEQLKFGNNYKTDSIYIVKTNTVEKRNLDLWQIEKNSVLSSRITKNSELKKTIESITSCFDFQNNITTGLVTFENIFTSIHLTAISSEEEVLLKDRLKEQNKASFFLKISKPNYNGNLAIVLYSYYCGGTCAGSDIIFFENKDDKWNILTTINLWIA